MSHMEILECQLLEIPSFSASAEEITAAHTKIAELTAGGWELIGHSKEGSKFAIWVRPKMHLPRSAVEYGSRIKRSSNATDEIKDRHPDAYIAHLLGPSNARKLMRPQPDRSMGESETRPVYGLTPLEKEIYEDIVPPKPMSPGDKLWQHLNHFFKFTLRGKKKPIPGRHD